MPTDSKPMAQRVRPPLRHASVMQARTDDNDSCSGSVLYSYTVRYSRASTPLSLGRSTSTMNDDKQRIEAAKWLFERTLGWIATADAKVGVAIALDTAMLGGLAAAFAGSDY